MCLTNVDQVFKGEGRKIHEGWKVFISSCRPYGKKLSKQYLFEYGKHRGSETVPTNRWITAERPQTVDGPGEPCYEFGFHIFDDLRAAEGWVDLGVYRPVPHRFIVKVQYRGVLVKGSQYSLRVTVAKHLYVSMYD